MKKAEEFDDADILYDLVFMDMESVEVDNFIEWVDQLYSEEMKTFIPIFISMSGQNNKEIIEDVQKSKVNYFVQKPFT